MKKALHTVFEFLMIVIAFVFIIPITVIFRTLATLAAKNSSRREIEK